MSRVIKAAVCIVLGLGVVCASGSAVAGDLSIPAGKSVVALRGGGTFNFVDGQKFGLMLLVK